MSSHKVQILGQDDFGKKGFFFKKNTVKYSINFNDPSVNKGVTVHFNNNESSSSKDSSC